MNGIELGGFVGYNGAAGRYTEFAGAGRPYVSCSGHAYWGAMPGSQPLRPEPDVLSEAYERPTLAYANRHPDRAPEAGSVNRHLVVVQAQIVF